MAAIRYRAEVEMADRIIYVTDIGQEFHFKQVFAGGALAGLYNPEKVKAISKAYRENNQEKIKAYNHHPLNAASNSITRLTGLKKSEIPTELLEAQALIIKIHREIKNNEKLHRA